MLRETPAFIAAACLTLVISCGSNDEPSETTGSGGGATATSSEAATTTGAATSSTTTTTGSGGSGAGGGATTTATTSASTAATTSTGQGGAGGDSSGAGGQGGSAMASGITPDITNMNFFFNCMPSVPADPVQGSFLVSYTNNGSVTGSATITKATLSMTQGAQTLDWDFTVTPAASPIIVSGGTSAQNHNKVQDSGSGPDLPCDYCGGNWTLYVDWDLGGGVTVSDSMGPVAGQCAF